MRDQAVIPDRNTESGDDEQQRTDHDVAHVQEVPPEDRRFAADGDGHGAELWRTNGQPLM